MITVLINVKSIKSHKSNKSTVQTMFEMITSEPLIETH